MSEGQITARRAQTRARLLDGARSVFAERGIQAASVEEICEAAGFTRGAFYSNFESKEELCVALLEQFRDVAYAAAEQAVEETARQHETTSVEELVERAIDVFLNLQRDDRDWLLVNAELRLYAVREPSLRAAFDAVYVESNRLFTALMEPALGAFGHHLCMPTDRALLVLQGAYEQASQASIISDGRLDARTARETLATVLRALVVAA